MRRSTINLAALILLALPAGAQADFNARIVGANPPTGHGVFRLAQAVAFTPGGSSVFVGDMRSAVIQKFDRAGNWQMEFGGYANHGQLGRIGVIGGIATDRNNHVYVLDSENDRVQVFRIDNGAWVGAFGAKGSGTGHFNLGENSGSGGISVFQPTAGDDPIVYIADQNNHRIQKILIDQLADGDPLPALPAGNRDPANHSNVPRATVVTTWGTFGNCVQTNCGGPGDQGVLDHPQGVTFNPQVDGGGDNNIYVADDDNHRVVQYKSDGTYINQVGNFGTGDSQFEFPYDVGVDSLGFLYVADNNNHRVQKFSAATLGFLGAWGGFGAAPGQFEYPRALSGLAEDPQGGTYVADNANNRVQGFDPNGAVTASWGIAGRGPGYVTRPNGVAVDAAGNVYIADTYDNRIEILGSSGAYIGQLGNISTLSGFAAPGTSKGALDLPSGIAVSPLDGSVWTTETGNERVQQFSAAGAAVAVYGGPEAGSGVGQFRNPDALAIDTLGNVFVADTDNNRIQWRNTKTGAWKVFAFNGVNLDDPASIAVYGRDLYVGDRKRVLKITQGKAIEIVPPGPAFNQPGGLWVDNGDLFISDTRNDRVLRLDTKGGWSTIGTEGLGVGSFNLPGGLAMSRDGSNLYVADTFNDRIQGFSFPARDLVAPTIKASAKARQSMRRQRWKVNVKATSNEKATVSVTGSIKLTGVKRALRLRKTKASLAAGKRRTVKLKMSKSVRRRVAKVLKRKKRARATLKLVATDGSKNSKTVTKRVRLVR